MRAAIPTGPEVRKQGVKLSGIPQADLRLCDVGAGFASPLHDLGAQIHQAFCVVCHRQGAHSARVQLRFVPEAMARKQ